MKQAPIWFLALFILLLVTACGDLGPSPEEEDASYRIDITSDIVIEYDVTPGYRIDKNETITIELLDFNSDRSV